MNDAAQKIRDSIKDLRERTDRHNWEPNSTAWHRAFGELSGLHHALSLLELPDNGGVKAAAKRLLDRADGVVRTDAAGQRFRSVYEDDLDALELSLTSNQCAGEK